MSQALAQQAPCFGGPWDGIAVHHEGTRFPVAANIDPGTCACSLPASKYPVLGWYLWDSTRWCWSFTLPAGAEGEE